MSDSITIELDRAIAFRAPSGEPIAAHGVALVLTGDGKTLAPAAQLAFRISAEVYDRIVEEALFGLVPGEPPSPFAQGRDLELEARLRPDVAARLIALGGGAEDLAIALVLPDAPAAFIAESESWQVLSVMQADGDVKSGFRVEPTDVLLEVARRAAERAGTPLEDAGDGLHRFMARAGDDAWTTLVRFDDRTCIVYAVLPELVPAERRAAVAQYLVDRNYYLNLGAFEMDLDDGEVRLRTSLDATHTTFDEAAFVNLVAAGQMLFELHLPTLRALAAGTLTLAEARARHG
ncbi:MAG: hypothetical protein HOV81_25330 [Kofleriaceae bacterium]|nr:hypothetical protein [Kofleriaceae bacterium]